MRARSIKPGFFKNEDLSELDPLTRILFAGLWCMADREGRLEDRPKRIKAEILPYDDVDVDAMLQKLPEDFIQRYEHSGARYIQIVNFLRHQCPHKNEKPSEIPAPGNIKKCTVQAPEQHSTSTGVLAPRARLLTPSSLTPDSGLLTPDSPKEDAAAVAGAREHEAPSAAEERSSSIGEETPETPPPKSPDPMDDDDPMDALLLALWEVEGWKRKPKQDREDLARLGAAFPQADLAVAIQQLRAKALDGAVKANPRSALQAFIKQLHLQAPEPRVIEDDAPPGPRVAPDWKTQAQCAAEAMAVARRMAAGGAP